MEYKFGITSLNKYLIGDELFESDCDGSDIDDMEGLTSQLVTFRSKCRLSRSKMGYLLAILRENGHPELPNDFRTLRNRARNLQEVKQMHLSKKLLYIGVRNTLDSFRDSLPGKFTTFTK